MYTREFYCKPCVTYFRRQYWGEKPAVLLNVETRCACCNGRCVTVDSTVVKRKSREEKVNESSVEEKEKKKGVVRTAEGLKRTIVKQVARL